MYDMYSVSTAQLYSVSQRKLLGEEIFPDLILPFNTSSWNVLGQFKSFPQWNTGGNLPFNFSENNRSDLKATGLLFTDGAPLHHQLNQYEKLLVMSET